ncbi:hypothetical protein BDV96DRAFT_285358 [Lophiotrema nucula]|uniref:DUF6536 domain-containing protein n=1 Tax=Lophiotrema nucula TaxID=690887 RepID=A0A6A5YMJ6_9PLEO|nr:hypothetical protein BDV96DRAFT_285358 [Lophiotrema nucula]
MEPRTLSRISVGIHLLINALSTILLAASNYTMQVLSSPTRGDLDKAHRSGKWFDIGVLSSRNLSTIPGRRLLLCIVLGFSSIPLHLFYNSAAIYIAATIDDYDIFLVDEGSTQWRSIASNDSYATLSNAKWSGEYDTAIVHSGDLYFAIDGFASALSNNLTTLEIDSSWPATVDWKSDLKGTRTAVQALSRMNITANAWLNLTSVSNGTTPNYAHIAQVLARNVPRQDRIVFVLSFLLIVIICNAVKLATMLYVLFKERADFNVTLGDTAASFLCFPDSSTEKMCVYPRDIVIADVHRRLANDPYEVDQDIDDEAGKLEGNDPKVWRKHSHPYTPPVTISRSLGSYFIIAVICISFPICTAAAFNVSRAWGTTSDIILGRFKVNSENTLLVAWLANTPQLILSFCYLSINSECTSMAGAYEWNNMGTSRKGLRVTKPFQDQRSTYFLQLPYRWSLPLAAVSGGIHWLLSQSIFLVRIDYYDRDGRLLTGSRLGCGISGLSIIVLCVSFWILVVAVASMGRRLLRVRIPFAASCSLVVSAACHPPSNDQEPHLKKVQWGVVEERMFEGELHCSLSCRPVRKPKPGTKYL